ncbi:hypothetical protein DY000_02002132, partial [Brassica cretica]
FPISVLQKIKNLKSIMDSQEAAREKVDFAQPVRDKESEWNHRRSLAWDSAFFTTPGVLDHEELFGSLKLGENEIDVNQKEDSIKKTLLPCVSSDIATRPSFAWDNAFLTEPGVLDAEELSLVNNGFTSNTQPRNSADSMTTTTEGSRFSVSSIELDLFNDLRASSNVKETRAQEIQRKLPDGNKRTKWYKLKSQRLSLIPQPKAYTPSSSSLSSSVSESFTPRQAKPEKKVVASELGENMIHFSFVLFKRRKINDLTSSSSGLRLPLPKMGFFDSVCFQRKSSLQNFYVYLVVVKKRYNFYYNRRMTETKKTKNQMLLQTEEDTSRNSGRFIHKKPLTFWANARLEIETGKNDYI